MLWGFIRRYAPGVSPETHPRLDSARAARRAATSEDFVKPQKTYRLPDEVEAASLRRLAEVLALVRVR